MLELFKSPRFQEEYQGYKEKIKKISNDSAKKELDILLNKLVNEVKMLDGFHQQMLSNKTLPIGASDAKNRIVELRKAIVKKIEECSTES